MITAREPGAVKVKTTCATDYRHLAGFGGTVGHQPGTVVQKGNQVSKNASRVPARISA